MQRLILLLLIMFFWLAAPISRAVAQELVFTETPTLDPQAVVITSPTEGQALKGNVSISGRVAVHGFAAYELSFTYSDNPTETWFLIQESSQLVEGDILGQWDTSVITDGVYDLRLVVERQESEPLIYTVSKLRVRNYTPVETNTPTPVTPTTTPLPGDTPVPTVTPTPTNTPIPPTMTVLPPNPAQITTQDVGLSVGKGALFSLGLFTLIGIYISIKNIRRRL